METDHNGRSIFRAGQHVQEIQTITLDLDDTLWAIGPVIARAEQRLQDWLAENYPRVPEQVTAERRAEIRTRVLAEHIDRAHDLTFLRREIIARVGRAAGYEVDVDAAFDIFDAERNTLELYPDVLPALRSLKRRFTLIAVTNGNADLEKIGISELFDGCVTARLAGVAKPGLTIFQMAVQKGGALPEQTLHVGDHPSMDVDGARAAGLRAVWINRSSLTWPENIARPDAVINDLHELDELLARH